MRILIDILHPAHVHFFRNFHNEMGARGHEMCMASAGRFTCVVFPCYLVMARLLERMGPASVLVLAAAAVLLGIYAALFAAGYGLI